MSSIRFRGLMGTYFFFFEDKWEGCELVDVFRIVIRFRRIVGRSRVLDFSFGGSLVLFVVFCF